MSDFETREALVWQAIGQYGAEIAETGCMAPPQYLLDAVRALTAAPSSGGEVTEAMVTRALYNANARVRDMHGRVVEDEDGVYRDIAAELTAALRARSGGGAS